MKTLKTSCMSTNIRKATLIAQFFLASLVVLAAAPVSANSACDYLRGFLRSQCKKAENSVHRNANRRNWTPPTRATRQPRSASPNSYYPPRRNNQYSSPRYSSPRYDARQPDARSVDANTPTARTVAPENSTSAAAGAYRSETFAGLKTWRDVFQKAANSPQEWANIRARMDHDANGPTAMLQGPVSGAKRNDLQKTLTDYALYALYYKNPQVLLDKQMQCLEPRDYSSAEACDCVAGFPGDTLIGLGLVNW